MSTIKFSVVLPTCHREDHLARCLESLRPGAQSAPADSYEVIVTDDAEGQTAEAMMTAKFPWARWIKGPSRGPASNRNNGARQAVGEWICFIDDDCVASREWIAVLDVACRDDTIDLLEGRTTIPDQADDPFLHAVTNQNGGAYWTCNLTVRRERFLSLGGFDEDFLDPAGEDMEFAHRYHAHHFRSQFYPEALVYHPARPISLRTIIRRHFWIKWAAMYHYKIDDELHLTDPPLRNILRALKTTVINHLRLTWMDLRAWNAPYPKSRRFQFLLRWITFPVYLPYYLYWVYRFQKQLEAKAS